MPLQPLIGIFLSGDNLAAGHARGENSDPILAGLVASSLSKNGPEVCFGEVLRSASARPVICAECRLGYDMSPFGGYGKPANGFGVFRRNVLSGGIVSSQSELGRGLPLLGQASQPFRAGRVRTFLPGS